MNLKNYQITVGELLANPRARAVLTREFPMVMGNPMLGRMRQMSLRSVITYARRYVPQQKINQMLAELQEI